MPTSKTAISLDSTLLMQTDKLAQETGNSRSGVIAIALKKYFHELEQQRVLEQLDLVYEDDDNSEPDLTNAAIDYFANHISDTSEKW